MLKGKEKTITLHIYADALQAKMMQDKLKVNGIESFLNDENVLGMDPIAGVELKVFEKDVEAAEKIIKAKN
jgi:hypothetical protein